MGGLDASVALWRDAVVANGGTVSAARLSIINTFVIAEVASGAWDLTDDYWSFWAENAVQALTSLKQRRLATAVNSPTFTPDRGYAFDGTTQYINTGFIPSTHAVAMTGTSLRIAVYERTNVAANGVAAGAYNSVAQSVMLTPRISGNITRARLNSSDGETGATITDSRGLKAAQRNGTAYAAYNNGSPLALSTPSSTGSSRPTVGIYIGAYNNAGSAAAFRACSLGLVSVGAAMSDAQNLAAYNAAQVFATAVGAQV
jgi:hypothetical protein